MLHYLSDLPVTVVAHVMGCEEGTVKAHLSKARAALSVLLTRTGESELDETRGRKHE